MSAGQSIATGTAFGRHATTAAGTTGTTGTTDVTEPLKGLAADNGAIQNRGLAVDAEINGPTQAFTAVAALAASTTKAAGATVAAVAAGTAVAAVAIGQIFTIIA